MIKSIFLGTASALLVGVILSGCAGEGSGEGNPNINSDQFVQAISVTPISGMAPLSVTASANTSNLNIDGSISSYQWDFGDGTVIQSATANHTYAAGDHPLTLTITKSDNTTVSITETIHVVDPINNNLASYSGLAPLFDDFEYAVDRAGPVTDNITNAFTANSDWNLVKAENISGSHNGYLYTTTEIPGYNGQFPGRNSTRVLAMESLPISMGSQTDFYLQYGLENGTPDTVPGNVWFQFWIYSNFFNDPNNQNDQLSQYGGRLKFIYPCNGNYPCQENQIKWLNCLGQTTGEPFWGNEDVRELYMTTIDPFDTDINYTGAFDWNRFKPGQSSLEENVTRNRWTLVKIHYDTSVGGTPTFQAWMRPLGNTTWTEVANWVDGDPVEGSLFNWTVTSPGGHEVFRIPTTVDDYDSWIYLDDFTMAESPDQLPTYPY